MFAAQRDLARHGRPRRPAVEPGAPALVRVLPRYSRIGGGLYVVWSSQKLVPAAVAVVPDALTVHQSIANRACAKATTRWTRCFRRAADSRT